MCTKAGQEEQIAVGTCDVTDKVISLVKKMEEIFVLQTRLAEVFSLSKICCLILNGMCSVSEHPGHLTKSIA